uniref:Uncharacterized protein n=1 Tax=Dulem virus 263 TaxID=3145740 RepID=A0AAU8ATH9_9VIRU
MNEGRSLKCLFTYQLIDCGIVSSTTLFVPGNDRNEFLIYLTEKWFPISGNRELLSITFFYG